MGGANEVVSPTKKSKIADDKSIGGLRRHINNDEVHVHDDIQGLRFVWPGTLSFRIHWREFLSMRGYIKEGERCAFIGETTGKKAATLVAERNRIGELEIYLEAFNPQTSYTHEIRKDEDVEGFTHWVERYC